MNTRALIPLFILLIPLLAACSGGPSSTVEVSLGPDTVQDSRGAEVDPTDLTSVDGVEIKELPKPDQVDIVPDIPPELPMCPEGEPCDDEDPCTEDDQCTDGVCAGTAYECDDGKDCTDDSCDGEGGCEFQLKGGNCLIDGVCYQEASSDPDNPCLECITTVDPHAFSADDTNDCADGDPCTVGDYCDGGECHAGEEALNCDDENPCTDDSCDVKEGGCYSVFNEGPCDDGDECTEDDICVEGTCAGVNVDCDDGNVCTLDGCEPETGCHHAAQDGPCEDSNPCSVDDFCFESVCQTGAGLLDCDDGNVCTTDSCDPAVDGGCVNAFNTDPCEDGDPCTTGDQCAGGVCVTGGGALDCDDGNPCSDDSCVQGVGCSNLPNLLPCNDGDVCTIGDQCAELACVPGNTPVDCDDDNVCTTDACDSVDGCVYSPAPGECEDGNACTVGDLCEDGSCMSGAAALACDDANPCTDDSCSPTTGCVHVNNDDQCEDGDECTLGDTCGGGVCLPGAGTPACGDGNVCTQDYCDPLEGCVHDPVSGLCDDGNPCTVGDECADGQCIAGQDPLECDDDDPCTNDLCDPEAENGCVYENNTASCDDGNECTETDTCQDGQCVGQPKSCNDGNPCTDDSCAPDMGCEYADNGNACEDDDPCTLGDTCVGGDCISGLGTLYCNDGNVCTNDSCEPGVGCKFTNTVGLCEDGNTCTVGDYCSAGQCVSGANQCVCVEDSDCADQEDGNFCNGILVCLKESLNPLEWSCVVDPGTVVACDPAGDTVCVQNQCQPQTGDCVLTPINTGGPCDDDDPCTGPDLCSAGDCLPGQTICECQEDEDCESQEDGNFCNGTLVCDTSDVDPLEWSCIVDPGTVVICDPAGDTTCLKNKCVPDTGACTKQPANQGGTCQDGDPCTGPDSCDGGACAGGPALCACQVDEDCAGQEDGNLCNGTLVCDTSSQDVLDWTCVVDPGTVLTCDPSQNTTCQEAQCVPATGACTMAPINEGSACSDADPCTGPDTCQDGACVPAGVICACQVDEDCAGQEDGNLCNGTLVCDTSSQDVLDWACVVDPGTVITCSPSQNTECEEAQCVPSNGQCVMVPINEGGACNDGNPCTDDDECVDGECVSGQNQCACQVDEDCADQEDGDLCNGTLICDTSSQDVLDWACAVDPGTVVVCDDPPNECSEYTCNPETGDCALGAANENGPCDDGDECSDNDICVQGECDGQITVSCNDGNLCTVDSCDPETGCVHIPEPDGTPCGGAGWTCSGGYCVSCSPECDGKECGGDGCGGSCGECLDDELSCTMPFCDDAGQCGFEVSNFYCVIEDSCLPSGTEQPGNMCLKCFPDQDQWGWSPIEDGIQCGAGGLICHDGQCCVYDCDGKECGDDGCGGTCGSCPGGDGYCYDGLCGECVDENPLEPWDGCDAGVITEVLVNQTTPNNQVYPVVQVGADDRFLVVWQDHSVSGKQRVLARLFEQDGTPATDDVVVSGEYTTVYDLAPDVTLMPDGRYLVAWHNGNVRYIDASGAIDGAGIKFFNGAYNVRVAARPDGNVFMAFLNSSGWWLAHGRFQPDGTQIGSLGSLTQSGYDMATGGLVTYSDNSSYAAWQKVQPGGIGQPDTNYSNGRKQTASGVDSWWLNPGGQYALEPEVDLFPDENMLLVWSEEVNSWDIHARWATSGGQMIGTEFKVNTTTSGAQRQAAVAINKDDRALVVWHSNQTGDYDVYARLFEPDGPLISAVTGEYRLNVYTTTNQAYPTVDTFSDGSFVVVWNSGGQDGNGSAIVHMRLDADGNKIE